MTTPDPLLERLRRLPRAPLDDVAAARTLARAESAFASAAHTNAGAGSNLARVKRAWVPAALALWGALYAWGAVRELGRLYPASPAQPAVAVNHRGPDGFDTDAQFMLNAISKARAMTTATMTITPFRPDTFRATSLSVAVPVCSEMSSDMDPSMQVVACDTRTAEPVRCGAGRGTIAAPTAAPPARAPVRSRAPARSGWSWRRGGA
jgi:hypothetical protein